MTIELDLWWCSLCPTFAAVACFIDNARWDGVPFLLKAGKALHSKRAEIRVQFRHVPGNLYKNRLGVDLDQTTNELVSLCLKVRAWQLDYGTEEKGWADWHACNGPVFKA